MNVAHRFMALFRRRGFIRDDVAGERDGDAAAPASPLDECRHASPEGLPGGPDALVPLPFPACRRYAGRRSTWMW